MIKNNLITKVLIENAVISPTWQKRQCYVVFAEIMYHVEK